MSTLNFEAELDKYVKIYNELDLKIHELRIQLRDLETQQIKAEGVVNFLTDYIKENAKS